MKGVTSGSLPAGGLTHATHGLGVADVGIGDHQPHTCENVLFEAGQILPPKRLALVVAHLETPQFPAPIGIYAYRHHDGAGADLQRLAQPPVQIVGTEVKVRVTVSVEGPLQKGLDLGIEPLADPADL